MGELEGAFVPDNSVEAEFMATVNVASKTAHDEGMALDDIAACMMFMASAILLYGDEAPEAQQPPAKDEDTKREDCPECETEIDSVRAFVGGECIIRPCACVVHHTRIPGWLDVEEDDDDG